MNKKGAFDSAVIMFSILGIMLVVLLFFMLFNFREYSSKTEGGVTRGELDTSVALTDLFIVYFQTPVYTCSLSEAKNLNMTYGELLLYAQVNDSTDYISDIFNKGSGERETVGGSKLLSSIWDYCTFEYFGKIEYYTAPSYVGFFGNSTHYVGYPLSISIQEKFAGTTVVIKSATRVSGVR